MNKITQAAVLCGGLGTRLHPITLDIPKPLVKVGEKPMLQIVLSKLVKSGIEKAVLMTGYRHDMIEDYFGNGKGFGLKIEYSVENKPLGSAGALLQTRDALDENFLVCNCDTISNYDLRELSSAHFENDSLATLLLAPVEEVQRFGIAELDAQGRVERFLEKPKPEETRSNLASLQIFTLSQRAFDYSKKESFSMEREVFPLICQKRRIWGKAIPQTTPWIDVGTLSDLEKTNADIEEGKHGWLFE